MKRLIIISLTLFLTVSSFAFNRPKIGVAGGLTTSQTTLKDIDVSRAGFHAGLTLKSAPLLGFCLQPSVLYNQKGTKYDFDEISVNSTMGYVEVPVQIQYGLDLVLLRPFVFVEPFVGYAVNNALSSESLSLNNQWDDVNRWEYGLGVGGGLDLGKSTQLSVKYFWNFDDANMDGNLGQIASSWWSSAKASATEKKSFTGLLLSLAVFF